MRVPAGCHHAGACDWQRTRSWFAVLLTSLTAAVAIGIAPPSAAAVTPIGNLGETLRVEFEDFVADVTVHDVLPAPVPPGWGWNGSPALARAERPVARQCDGARHLRTQSVQAGAVHHLQRRDPYADAYSSKHTDAPDVLEKVLLNAPPGIDRHRRRLLGRLPRAGHQRGDDQSADRNSLGAVEHLAAGHPLP